MPVRGEDAEDVGKKSLMTSQAESRPPHHALCQKSKKNAFGRKLKDIHVICHMFLNTILPLLLPGIR